MIITQLLGEDRIMLAMRYEYRHLSNSLSRPHDVVFTRSLPVKGEDNWVFRCRIEVLRQLGTLDVLHRHRNTFSFIFWQ